MSETRTFGTGAVLSAATGYLLCDIQDVYEILNWLTNDNLFTRQLSRALGECRPWLLRWFPELYRANPKLLDIMLKDVDENAKFAVCKVWVIQTREAQGMKEAYDIPRIPTDDHEYKNPYDELVSERGTDEGVVLVRVSDPD